MLGKIKTTSTCLFLQPTWPVCRYVVVRPGESRPQLIAAGSFDAELPEALVEHMKAELASRKVSVSRAVLLLPRGNVEVNSLRMPPASEDELPEMVSNVIAQQVDDSGEANVHDFVVSETHDDESQELLTFTVTESILKEWSSRFREQGIRLQSVTFGGIGAVQLLESVSVRPARTSMVVTSTDQDTDLVVVESGRPRLFRTIPRATGDDQFVIQQLAGDIQRTLTLVGHPDDEQTRIYLIGTVGEQQDAAEQLSQQLGLSVSMVNPFDQLDGQAVVDKPSRFANLIGAACAWNRGSLVVDLLNPRKPAVKKGPWGRVAFWGSVVALLAAIAGYLLWEQGAEQRELVADQKVKLQRLIKPARKAQTKLAISGAIDAWRASEVSWLDELDILSARMPPAADATAGNLNMVSAGTTGRIDLSVEVSHPDVRMQLEEAIRDSRHAIRSKRVTDASNRSSSVWRFQTSITVAPEPATLPELIAIETADDTESPAGVAEVELTDSEPAPTSEVSASEASSSDVSAADVTTAENSAADVQRQTEVSRE